MLSKGHMGASLYRYTGQVGPRCEDSGSLVEWKWCHYVMVEADIPLRPLHTSPLCICKVFDHCYAVSRTCGCILIPLHQPSWPQIWEVRVTWGVKMMSLRHGWGWYPPQTTSYIHTRCVHSVWAIGMLSQENMGAPLYHYTGQVGPRFGDSGSLEEWKWCHNVMFEAVTYHRPLPASIVDIYKGF
jgi:hypothetical protein